MATLGTMAANVKLLCGNKNGVDTLITNNINHAIWQFTLQYRPQDAWRTKTFNTIANTAEYTFSSIFTPSLQDILAILMVRNVTDDVELKRGDMRSYNRNLQDTSNSAALGRPNRWTRIGNSIVLYNKIPDSVKSMKITYLKRHDTLSGSSDQFAYNDEYVRLIETLAAAITLTDLLDTEHANLKYAAYDKLIAAMEKPEEIEDEAPEASIRLVHNLNY